jgi:50S ribosomal protein L16 3-hydroxylase
MPIFKSLNPLRSVGAETFMERYWQRRPLLLRQAVPDVHLLPGRAEMFALAGQEDVEARLVTHLPDGSWTLKHGPFRRRALPPLSQRAWTLLVQGVDLHNDATRALLDGFRFIPDARIDDAMISFATDGGGVGPHVDSYDVFLLQIHGRRRWRTAPAVREPELMPNVPLRILADFSPLEDEVLEPGDMLYLPPGYAHEGVAVGECMTCSIGFRSPSGPDLARELLQRIAEAAGTDEEGATSSKARRLYRDRGQSAAQAPAVLPSLLVDFASNSVQALLRDPDAVSRALGEYLTEPKAQLWFERGEASIDGGGIRLDRKTRILYDARHVFINGESIRASGADLRLMRRLADQRALSTGELARASSAALDLLQTWCDDGWVHPERV